jgi:hypothetical protein
MGEIVAYKNGLRGVFSELSWKLGKCADKGWVIPSRDAKVLPPESVTRFKTEKITIPKVKEPDIVIEIPQKEIVPAINDTGKKAEPKAVEKTKTKPKSKKK